MSLVETQLEVAVGACRGRVGGRVYTHIQSPGYTSGHIRCENIRHVQIQKKPASKSSTKLEIER